MADHEFVQSSAVQRIRPLSVKAAQGNRLFRPEVLQAERVPECRARNAVQLLTQDGFPEAVRP